jgi:hypothetical protein
MRERTLAAATFLCLVIVMLANVAAGFANWQAYEDRRQTQELFEKWRRQADDLAVRIAALEAAELAKPPQPQRRQQ